MFIFHFKAIMPHNSHKWPNEKWKWLKMLSNSFSLWSLNLKCFRMAVVVSNCLAHVHTFFPGFPGIAAAAAIQNLSLTLFENIQMQWTHRAENKNIRFEERCKWWGRNEAKKAVQTCACVSIVSQCSLYWPTAIVQWACSSNMHPTQLIYLSHCTHTIIVVKCSEANILCGHLAFAFVVQHFCNWKLHVNLKFKINFRNGFLEHYIMWGIVKNING